MKYFASASTDVGIVKKTNQDSVCVKIAEAEEVGQVAMVVLCDGMGGLAKGELASATVIRRFCLWFENEFPRLLLEFSWEKLGQTWVNMIKTQNEKLMQYGKSEGVNLGTTLSAFLAMDGKYIIAQVGDSRVYEITDSVKQLTEDQTFIHREITAGRMTEEEAAVHPKRNMLLQCIGASREVNPVVQYGEMKSNTNFMFCSDGFRHVLTNEEMFEQFNPDVIGSTSEMKQRCEYLIDVVKRRNERDNITVALLKAFN